MAYNVRYKSSVAKDLQRLDKKEARRVFDKIDRELASHAESYPALKGDFAGLRKMRVGDYRVIYAILDNEVLILRIGHRGGVYR